ncbi:Arylsulfatase [Crateriforma conspicua]|uniref:Arylsulfatase n=1 Tax=Crateriforma conspicua TaxID=2527996 RepID=A0A5C6FXE6_9PLAN|nr:Arylsulfatase [Crateriforma conspicua]
MSSNQSHIPVIRPRILILAGWIAAVSSLGVIAQAANQDKQDGNESAAKPNFVIIFADDQGYGDLSCFGSQTIATPNIDRLATDGRKFTNFMVASPVCTPSRAALLTGCYPKRVGMHQHVLFPASTKGLNPDEHTIADHLKGQGYATACFGKWHLGHHPEVLPISNGFDTYFGIPYSNDMNHPDNKGKPKGGPDGMDVLWKDPESTLTKWNTPLFEDDQIVELPVDQRTVTRRYTQKAIDFITDHRDGPFFVYLPHSMPHIPLYVPDDVRDPNPLNAYINVIEHIDTEVGRLLDTLDKLNLTENTYVIYTTDNGPWLTFKHHGGSAGPLRDGKGTTFEGGQRVPCLMRGPGIPAGTVCDALTGTIDVLPTIASITGTPLPDDKKIDGMDMSELWMGTIDQSPRDEFVYYTSRGDVEGIRLGKWKLLVKKPRQNKNAKNPKPAQVMLFDLSKDIGEQNNLADAKPDVVQRLRNRMMEADEEITRNAREPWHKEK